MRPFPGTSPSSRIERRPTGPHGLLRRAQRGAVERLVRPTRLQRVRSLRRAAATTVHAAKTRRLGQIKGHLAARQLRPSLQHYRKRFDEDAVPSLARTTIRLTKKGMRPFLFS